MGALLFPLADKGDFMNPTTKKLLAKKKLSGKDIGRLLIANLIDVYNGEGLPHEQIWNLMQSLQTEQDSIDYELYRRIFNAIDETRDLYVEKMKQADIACIGLRTFYEAVLFANSTYPDCRWDKYCLDKITQETRDAGDYMWIKLRNSIQTMLAIRGAFKAASAWLKIPKLETILPNDEKSRLQVDSLNKFARHARLELSKLGLSKKMRYEVELLIGICDFYSNIPSEEDITKAKKTFSLPRFEYDLEDAIVMMNPYYELDV